MQPISVTVTSSGSSPWKLTNWHAAAPMQIGFSAATSGLSSTWQVDVMLQDPSSTYPSTTQTIWQASAVGGSSINSSNAVFSISTCPIAAWRVTNNSTGGTVTVTALQVGIG